MIPLVYGALCSRLDGCHILRQGVMEYRGKRGGSSTTLYLFTTKSGNACS